MLPSTPRSLSTCATLALTGGASRWTVSAVRFAASSLAALSSAFEGPQPATQATRSAALTRDRQRS